MRWAVALALALCASPLKAQFSPMRADKALVAGSSDKGYRDGEFWHAAFDAPAGMALSEDGQDLYVGDTGNRAIRRIKLGRNSVSTLLKLKDDGPKDASDLAVLGGALFFTPSDGKGLWRTNLATPGMVQFSGSSVTADSVGAPVAVSTLARVYWLTHQVDGSICLASSDGEGVSPTVSAPIAELGKGPLPRLCFLDGYFYVHGSILGEVARIGVAFGYAALAQTITPATVSAAVIPWSLVGTSSTTPWSGHGCFVGWEPGNGGILLACGTTRTAAIYDPVGNSITTPDGPAPAVPLPIVSRILSADTRALYDPFRKVLLFSDRQWNRIVSVSTDYLTSDENAWAWSYYYGGPDPADAHEDGVTQLLVVANSIFVVMSDYGDKGHMKLSMWKQFERYLNMENALGGSGRRYEVTVKGANLGITRGVFAFPVNQQAEFDRLKADEILVTLDYGALVTEIVSLTENTQVDDLVAPEIDPEWALKPGTERRKGIGPLTQEWYKLVKEGGGSIKDCFKLDATQKVVFPQDPGSAAQTLMGDPRFVAFSLKYADKMLGKLEKANKAGRKISFLIMPFSNYHMGEIAAPVLGNSLPKSSQDLSETYAELIRAHGFGVVNMIPSCRAVGLSFQPFYYENDHYESRGHPWLGMLAARLFYKESQAAPQEAP